MKRINKRSKNYWAPLKHIKKLFKNCLKTIQNYEETSSRLNSFQLVFGRLFGFRPRSRPIEDLRSANDPARHAGHDGMNSFLN